MFPYSQLTGYIEGALALAAIAVAVYHNLSTRRHHKIEIANLRAEIGELGKDKEKLRKEIDALGDVRTSKFTRLVGQALLKLEPPTCMVCKELLLLRFATTFVEATDRLVCLQAAVEQSIDREHKLLVLRIMESVARNKFWDVDLEKPDPGEKEEYGKKPERQLITQAVSVCVSLISQLSDDEIERAIQLCVNACDDGSLDLKTEAARNLLPRLLVATRGHSSLIFSYRRLFETGCCETLTEDQKTILAAAIGGLGYAVAVDSEAVGHIWETSFNVLTKHIDWAWSGDPMGGTHWTNAIEGRLRYAGLEEKKYLKMFTGRYLEKSPEAPSHAVSYRQIANLNAQIRCLIDPNLRGFRIPDRAIVPRLIPVQITLKGVPSTQVMVAELVNFSLDESHGKIVGRGAWAMTQVSPAWVSDSNWREASVRLLSTPEGILFDQAKVLGPLAEGEGPNCYSGFRIQLGPTSPEGAINSLKAQWDAWPKR